MIIHDNILKRDERISLLLRGIYAAKGYSQFKMSKFEEYDLYMRNKEFLISDDIITFTDTNGKLLALKPDVTLSIVKNAPDVPGQVRRLYYTEHVYRASQSSHAFREIMQTGLECIGDITPDDIRQVISLAAESAAQIEPEHRMVFSHIGFVSAYLDALHVTDPEIFQAIGEKNADLLKKCCTAEQLEALLPLLETYADAASAGAAVSHYCRSEAARQALEEFSALWETLYPASDPRVCVDFTVSNATGYYSGVVFKCYIPGVAAPVLSGGQYDGLMRKLGRSSRAIGFAVYLDELERMDETASTDYINIALPKGRLGEKVYRMFEQAGYECPAIHEENRKLIFENPEKKVRYFWVKPSDVAIYVARGAADIGVAGADILLEYRPEVYELCDLGLGKCRMAVAAPRDFQDDESKTLRVATKFSRIASDFYAKKCREIDIIHLNGSIELAPILGLSDVIVDIVETGKTLLENGLEPREDIVPISARLIANKAAYRFKKPQIDGIQKSIAKQVQTV